MGIFEGVKWQTSRAAYNGPIDHFRLFWALLDHIGTLASLLCLAILGPKRAILEHSVRIIGGWQYGRNYFTTTLSNPKASKHFKVRSQRKKKRYYLGIFPKRRTPPPPTPTPPFWEPLIQKKFLVFILHFRT